MDIPYYTRNYRKFIEGRLEGQMETLCKNRLGFG
jgi:hypothetical protein